MKRRALPAPQLGQIQLRTEVKPVGASLRPADATGRVVGQLALVIGIEFDAFLV